MVHGPFPWAIAVIARSRCPFFRVLLGTSNMEATSGLTRSGLAMKLRGQTMRLPHLVRLFAGWPFELNPNLEKLIVDVDGMFCEYVVDSACILRVLTVMNTLHRPNAHQEDASCKCGILCGGLVAVCELRRTVDRHASLLMGMLAPFT